jgi:hypothetical protein
MNALICMYMCMHLCVYIAGLLALNLAQPNLYLEYFVYKVGNMSISNVHFCH